MSVPERRILFVLQHAGYLRPYLPVIRELGRSGVATTVVFAEPARNPADQRLEDALPAHADLGIAPQRTVTDGWFGVAFFVRVLADATRYSDRLFSNAPALRQRATFKARGRIAGSGLFGSLVTRGLMVVVATSMRIRSTFFARLMRRVLRACEDAIPTSPEIDAYLAEQRPDVVVVSPLVEFGSRQVDYLKSARKLGLATVVAVASWDNLTNKGLIRFVPDVVVVWNKAQAREAIELHDIPPDRVTTTGAQRFDEWFERKPSESANTLTLRAGIAADQPFILYVCSSSFVTPNEVPFVESWLTRLRADEELKTVGVVVRPYPKHMKPWQGVDLARFGNAAIYPRDGAEPDADDARDDFFDALAHASAVVGVNTSVLLEAAILGKPVLALVTDDFAQTQYGTLHFLYLLEENGGFLEVAHDLDEHLAQLRSALANPNARAAVAEKFVQWFLRPNGLDRPATPIVAEAIASATPHLDRVPNRRMLRLLLRPFAMICARAARSGEGQGTAAALEDA